MGSTVQIIWSNTCFKLFNRNENEKPNFTLCTCLKNDCLHDAYIDH